MRKFLLQLTEIPNNEHVGKVSLLIAGICVLISFIVILFKVVHYLHKENKENQGLIHNMKDENAKETKEFLEKFLNAIVGFEKIIQELNVKSSKEFVEHLKEYKKEILEKLDKINENVTKSNL